MPDLDHLLHQLADLPLDPRLGGIDDAVLAGMKAARTPALSGRALGVVAVLGMGLSLGLGVALSAQPGAPVPLALGVAPQLLPSTLLAAEGEQ